MSRRPTQVPKQRCSCFSASTSPSRSISYLRRVYLVPSQSHLAIVASIAASVVVDVDSSVLCLGSAFVFGFAFSHEANAARASSIARHSTVGPSQTQSEFEISEFRNSESESPLPSLSLSQSQSQSGSVCLVITKASAQAAATVFALRCVCCVVVIQAIGVCCPLSFLSPPPSPAPPPPPEAYTKLSKLEAVQFNLCVLLSSPSQLPSLSVFVAM